MRHKSVNNLVYGKIKRSYLHCSVVFFETHALFYRAELLDIDFEWADELVGTWREDLEREMRDA